MSGYSLGSLSMTCFGVGVDVRLDEEGAGAAAVPPDAPPEQSNI